VSQKTSPAAAVRWAKKLAKDVVAVVERYPDADPEDVRLTLISLQQPPLERLNRSLRRGQGFAAFRK
jgi:septum formation topological specificity factor MinE